MLLMTPVPNVPKLTPPPSWPAGQAGKLTLQDRDRAAMRRLGLDTHPNIR